MPRAESHENTRNEDANSGNNRTMNLNNSNMNATGGDGNGSGTNSGGSSSRRKSSGSTNMSVNEQIRQRYAHHGPAGGGVGTGGGVGMGMGPMGPMGMGMMGGIGGAGESSSMSAAAVAAAGGASMAAMSDFHPGFNNPHYQHHHQFPMAHFGAGAGGLGSFGPGCMNMNMNMNMNYPMNMNPSLYMGSPAAAAASMAGLQQQGDHFTAEDYRNAAAAGVGGSGGAPGGATATNPDGSSMGPMSQAAQAEREEDLLLNLLIARRQRSSGAQGAQQMGQPGGAGPGGAGGQPTSWVDDFMRVRRETQDHMGMGVGATGGDGAYDGMGINMHEGEASQSHRSAQASARMNSMNHLSNMNNMNMPGGASSNEQFLMESSRLRQQRAGSASGLQQMGSPQAAWMGGNSGPGAAAAAMQQQMQNRGEPNFAVHHQRQDMNTQLGLDVLERADRMMPSSMMHDARMADQGNMSQHQFNQFSMGRRHQGQMPEGAALGYGKRSVGGHAKGSEKPDADSKADGADTSKKPKRRPHKKKPADMPRRPLSAYNLFFSKERQRILEEIDGKSQEEIDADEEKRADEEAPEKKEGEEEEAGVPKALLRPMLPSEKKRRPHRRSHGKISFQLLAKKVGERWKALPDDQRKYYQDLAKEDMKRQKKAMEEYYQKRSEITAEAVRKDNVV